VARQPKLGQILSILLLLGSLGSWHWSPLTAFALSLSGAALLLLRRTSSPEPLPEEPPRRFETIAMPSLATARPPKEPVLDAAPPAAWREVQQALDQENATSIAGLCYVARQALGCRTVSVFFPGSDGSARLRAWDTASEDLQPGALAQAGKGLLGLLLKRDGRSDLFEPNMPTSAGCDWYAQPAIKTLCACRFELGQRLGLVVADDGSPNAMGREALDVLSALADSTRHLLERGSRLAREGRQKEVFAKLLEMERDLSELTEESSVHARIQRFLSELLPDGTSLLLQAPESASSEGRVTWAHGPESEGFEDFPYDVPGRGVLSQALARGTFMARRLTPGEMPVLLASGEPSYPLQTVGDLLVFPMRMDDAAPAALCLLCPDHQRLPPFLREAVELVASSAGQVLARIRATRDLENLATRDGLTGLVNHRAFQAALRREILRARRTGQTLAFFLTDIDHFKKVNDTWGHPAGDAVLRHVAGVVRQQVREDLDVVARYGGEEFACILIGASPEVAMETAERVRAAVESTSTDLGNQQSLPVTLSIGVSLFPHDGKEPEELVERADQALYRAKHGGRNRVERALGPG